LPTVLPAQWLNSNSSGSLQSKRISLLLGSIEDSAGCPPTHTRVRDIATQILQMGGDNTPLSKKWITHFIQRNPRIASQLGRTVDCARSAVANQEDIKAFFELYSTTCKELSITPENTWNMDETGVAQGACDNSRVLIDAKERRPTARALVIESGFLLLKWYPLPELHELHTPAT
jgi:hypothetical protein